MNFIHFSIFIIIHQVLTKYLTLKKLSITNLQCFFMYYKKSSLDSLRTEVFSKSEKNGQIS